MSKPFTLHVVPDHPEKTEIHFTLETPQIALLWAVYHLLLTEQLEAEKHIGDLHHREHKIVNRKESYLTVKSATHISQQPIFKNLSEPTLSENAIPELNKLLQTETTFPSSIANGMRALQALHYFADVTKIKSPDMVDRTEFNNINSDILMENVTKEAAEIVSGYNPIQTQMLRTVQETVVKLLHGLGPLADNYRKKDILTFGYFIAETSIVVSKFLQQGNAPSH